MRARWRALVTLNLRGCSSSNSPMVWPWAQELRSSFSAVRTVMTLSNDGTKRRLRVLLQCSIPFAEDNWHVVRFSLLGKELSRWADVTARNREPDRSGDDPILLGLDLARFDELWVLAVDGGDGLTPPECAAVDRFQAAGGGLLTARDHADMGRWLRSIDGVGKAHFFHDASCWEPDPARRVRDDQETPGIEWPNYHSG